MDPVTMGGVVPTLEVTDPSDTERVEATPIF